MIESVMAAPAEHNMTYIRWNLTLAIGARCDDINHWATLHPYKI